MKDRRELLKGLAVSSAWATPVVNSVMLPVHAEISTQEMLNSVEVICNGPTVQVRSSTTDRLYSISIGPGNSGTTTIIDLTANEVSTNNTSSTCPASATGSGSLPFSFPTAPTTTFGIEHTAGSSTYIFSPQ